MLSHASNSNMIRDHFFKTEKNYIYKNLATQKHLLFFNITQILLLNIHYPGKIRACIPKVCYTNICITEIINFILERSIKRLAEA